MKTYLINFKNAFVALMLFRTYTVYPRWFEIFLGLAAWSQVVMIVAGLNGLLK